MTTLNKMKYFNKSNIIQFIKFAIVGIFNTGIDWVVFFLLNMILFFDIHESFAKAVSFLFAAVNSFILNSLWTFKTEYFGKISQADDKQEKAKTNSRFFAKFLIVSLVGWGINTLIFSVFRYQIFHGLQDIQSKIISLAFASLIVLIWNYLANKLWTYKISD